MSHQFHNHRAEVALKWPRHPPMMQQVAVDVSVDVMLCSKQIQTKKGKQTGKALCQTSRPLQGPFAIPGPAESGPHPASFSRTWQLW